MGTPTIWLLKLILSHLFTDFVLQPRSWVEDRNKKHFGSIRLYLHGIITGIVALLFVGWQYIGIALIIFLSHTLIDGLKSYLKQTPAYFIVDQVLHLMIIGACFYFTFFHPEDIIAAWNKLSNDVDFWKMVLSVVFLTWPAGIAIGLLTRQWRDKITVDEDRVSLANAGKWIGMMERIIVFILVIHNQYSAIGLLVAAKGIIRFSEKDRPEIKTEYLVIGTLMSIGIAIVTGLAVRL